MQTAETEAGWSGDIEGSPVPLAFFARRMIDHRHRPAPGSPTRRTRRTQPPASDLAGERHVTLPIPQPLGFVEQCRCPKMGILGQPLPNISLDHIERIRLRRPPLPRGSAHQKGELVTVLRSLPRCRAIAHIDQPRFLNACTPHVFLLCQHQRWGSLSFAAGALTQQLGEDHTQRLVFAVTRRGCSVIETG